MLRYTFISLPWRCRFVTSHSFPRFLSTIFALSSGSLPSGVAIVRISGPESLNALQKLTLKKPEHFIPKMLFYTKIYDISEKVEDAEVLDNAMAVWLPGPHTFTGENTVELYLHGSRAVVKAVSNALSKLENVLPAKAGEFTKRAFYNGKYTVSQVESLNDLINAETDAQRKLAMKLNSAAKHFKPIRERLINLAAQIEASIDFAEDIGNQKMGNFSRIAEDILNDLRKFERGAARGSLIRDGIKVALLGKTNVGKSSLMNRLAEKDIAIVSNISGTTRDYLETRLILNAIPVTVIDTAGFRSDEDISEIEKEGIRRSFLKGKEADIIVFVADAQKMSDSFDKEMEEFRHTFNIVNEIQKIFLCLNKADLLNDEQRNQLELRLKNTLPDDTVSIAWSSCLEDSGLSVLLSSLQIFIDDHCNVEVDDVILSRERHIFLLKDSITEMQNFLECLHFDLALAAQHLRNCANFIGEISGTIVNEQILDALFSQFCIGK